MKIVRFLALLPRNVCVAILRAYRATISPLYGDVCRYYPSCSTYTLSAIQQHGAVKGIALGAWRIVRCNPWSQGGIDDVPHDHHHPIRLLAGGFVVYDADSPTDFGPDSAAPATATSVASTPTAHTSGAAATASTAFRHGHALVGSTRKG